jgi:hypothetical protein
LGTGSGDWPVEAWRGTLKKRSYVSCVLALPKKLRVRGANKFNSRWQRHRNLESSSHFDPERVKYPTQTLRPFQGPNAYVAALTVGAAHGYLIQPLRGYQLFEHKVLRTLKAYLFTRPFTQNTLEHYRGFPPASASITTSKVPVLSLKFPSLMPRKSTPSR